MSKTGSVCWEIFPALILAACGHARTPEAVTPAPQGDLHSADVLLVVGESTCDGHPSALPTELDLQLLHSTLSQLYPHAHVTTLRNPSVPRLLAHLRASAQRPLVVYYSGHATFEETGATLCLQADRLAMRDAFAQVDAGRPSAMWWVNACYSHHVDVRLATVPTAVVSVSDTQFISPSDRPTELAFAMARALQAGDLNSDGLTTDEELFASANRAISGEGFAPGTYTRQSLTLRLRQQARVPLVLFSTPIADADDWITDGSSVAENSAIKVAARAHIAVRRDIRRKLPEQLALVIVDDASTTFPPAHTLASPTPFALVVRRSAAHSTTFVSPTDLRSIGLPQLRGLTLGHGVHTPPHRGNQVYFPNYVPANGLVTIDGQGIDAATLRASPCQNHQIGQCFSSSR